MDGDAETDGDASSDADLDAEDAMDAVMPPYMAPDAD